MSNLTRRFAGPALVFLVATGLEVSGIEDIRIALAVWGIAAVWAGLALVTWPPFARRIPGAGKHVNQAMRQPAAVSSDESIILLEPRNGDTVTTSVTVRGYARTFEANVVIQASRDGGEWVTVGVTTAKEMAEDHTAYETTVWLNPGEHRLRVGDFSPRDGAWSGVEVNVVVR